MTLDDREPGRLLGLADGAFVDIRRPGDQLVIDVGGHVTPPSQLELLEVVDRGSFEHTTITAEPRAVTGTVPAALGRIEIHEAAEMATHCGHRTNGSVIVAVRGNRFALDAH